MKEVRIVFLGPGGVGKTTIIKELKPFLKDHNFAIYDERPVLMQRKYQRYQKNMKKNAFKMQKYFFKKRFKQHQRLFSHDRALIDRDIIDDFIYPRIQIKLNNFSQTQAKKWKKIEAYYLKRLSKISKIDMAFILHVDFAENMKRINNRASSNEIRTSESLPQNHDFFKLSNEAYIDRKSILYKTLKFAKNYIIIDNHDLNYTVNQIISHMKKLLEN